MRWTGTDDPWLRYGAAYWNHRATEGWDKTAHAAFGDEAAMAAAHRNLSAGLRAVADKFLAPPRILDIGCGFGASYVTAKLMVPIRAYIGVDCCAPYIAQAKKDFPGVDWRCEDAMTFDLEPKVDLVLTCATVTSLESVWPQLIRRAFERWLVPGGRMVVGEQTWFMVLEGPL